MAGLILSDKAKADVAKKTDAPLTEQEQADLEAARAKIDPTEDWDVFETGFSVLIGTDGQVMLGQQDTLTGVKVKRPFHNHDLIGALSVLLVDLQTNVSAVATVGLMQQQAQAMQRQMAEQAQMQHVSGLLNGGKK